MTTQGFINDRYEKVTLYDISPSQILEKVFTKFPRVKDLGSNDIGSINVAYLFCDIKGYTKLVTKSTNPNVIARIMTIYVTEMAAVIRQHGGKILSIRGDGIIGSFLDNEKNNSATETIRCALTMKTLLKYVINKRIKLFNQSPIDCHWGAHLGKVKIIKAGIRGEDKNDLVYVADAINLASKFCDLAKENQLIISEKLYKNLQDYYKKDENGWKWTKTFDSNYGNYFTYEMNQWKGITDPKISNYFKK